jgi:hypothetical protein
MPCRLQSSEKVVGKSQDCSNRSARAAQPVESACRCHSLTACHVNRGDENCENVAHAVPRAALAATPSLAAERTCELFTTIACGGKMWAFRKRFGGRIHDKFGVEDATDIEKHEKLWAGRRCNQVKKEEQ